MELPAILQGDSLTRLLQGAAVGAAVTMIVGFNWGGWALGSTVDKVAKDRADSAVVVALAPICVDRFRQAANATENLSALNKISYAWTGARLSKKAAGRQCLEQPHRIRLWLGLAQR
jgi:hypothetical protein